MEKNESNLIEFAESEKDNTSTAAVENELFRIPLPKIPSLNSPMPKLPSNPLSPLDAFGINTRRKLYSPILESHKQICEGVTDVRLKIMDLLNDGTILHTKNRVETVCSQI